MKGEFVIVEDDEYQMSDMVFVYSRAFVSEDAQLYLIDAPYKAKEGGYQMESYTYDAEGIVDSYTLYFDEYGIKLNMKEGTLLGVKREPYVLKENGKDVILVHSGQYAKITGKMSNQTEDDLPGIPVFRISSDDGVEEEAVSGGE